MQHGAEEAAEIQVTMENRVKVCLSCQDLKHRYGNPLVVLNLVKRSEKRPREMWLGREFEAAIEYANKQVSHLLHLLALQACMLKCVAILKCLAGRYHFVAGLLSQHEAHGLDGCENDRLQQIATKACRDCSLD